MNSQCAIIKGYLENNAIFADAFNFYLYSGKQVINPNDLIPLDVSELDLYFSANGLETNYPEVPHQFNRDILKSAVLKQYRDTILVMFGIANLNDASYVMHVGDVIFEELQYPNAMHYVDALDNISLASISDDIGWSISCNGCERPPIITLMLYFGAEKLSEESVLNKDNESNNFGMREYLQDYRLNLLAPASIALEELNIFQTSLKQVLGYIKYSNDRDELVSFIGANPDTSIDAEAALVISTMTKTYIDIPNGAKEINMCNAIMDLINDSRAEGILEGMSKGRVEGIAEGVCKGRAEGRNEGFLCAIIGLVRDNMLSIRDASIRVGMTEEAFLDMLEY